MDMLYEAQQIKCGNHTLDPEITIEAAKYEAAFRAGATTYMHKIPIATIRCAKCGRTAQATHYKIDQPVRERTFY